ncbi:FAD-dependent oxidoreductase [Candidatus Nasuia deltocephalinicola]|nr:FAD-dependent oxidoreductase [Candidatus Nasuia deltocephalinicola]WKD87103.1 FAD-dependent oxidoreductase [Candidatus Nasuia deltocephalinicola]
MFKIKYSKILVLGSGPSGLTSSLYIIRSNINLIIVTGNNIGGQLNNTNIVENWPSIKSIKGSELMKNFYLQILYFNAEVYNDEINYLNLLNKPLMSVGFLNFYYFNFLIISTGCKYKIFNYKNQFKYIGKNISSCAVCDSNFYKNKNILIIGNGDSCFENIFYLIKIIKNILLICRNKIFKTNYNIIKKIFLIMNDKIKFKMNSFLLEFVGDDYLLFYVKIKNFFNFNLNIYFLEGLFLFIGNIPNSNKFFGQLKINKNFILNKKKFLYNYTLTSINQIFSIGDVQDFLYKQAVTSSASGCFSYFDLINSYKKYFNV